jgi:DNA topoisomerase-1
VQQGEGDKPKRSSLPKGLAPADLTIEKALKLLALPREVARHPDTKEPILANLGRYGPYVQHGKTYANLGKDDDVLEIGGNRAIDLIRAKESGLSGRSFGKQASTASRALGDHPQGGAVAVKAGRFGPYVSWGKINATLPKDADPTTFSLDEAVTLLAAKAAGASTAQGRALGDHPDGGAITVRAGRFGPYVAWGKIYATLPKDVSPDTIGLRRSVAADRGQGGQVAGQGPGEEGARQKRPRRRRRAPPGMPGPPTTAFRSTTPGQPRRPRKPPRPKSRRRKKRRGQEGGRRRRPPAKKPGAAKR